MNKENESKLKIKNSFINLISKKGFDALTVTDIARDAEINRGTFYLHYTDKYNLIDLLKEDIMTDLENIFYSEVENENTNIDEIISYNIILKSINYLKENFDLIRAMFIAEGESNFMLSLRNILANLLFSKLKDSAGLDFSNSPIKLEYSIELFLHSIISVISLWIRRNGVETPEEIAEIISISKNIAPKNLISG
ncbi:TetR/AcrR family transcriptional regulator [Peptoniphilus sp. MSJ-1]|uniref:TetR/AcrR family transcriptional regulator n=1 Tax=Peptoniphilus ovalis TaxID=2841503 RepID=A0ABS6FEI5_9FIRM|nr:TetR/AcrR family transcriptional regulator C-terminal domain-containing protein [Peptoniphilus ovalis]MBU5668366.1 TetR/AcrR family transcriptional regulator [Peptoniphilus ovalis]